MTHRVEVQAVLLFLLPLPVQSVHITKQARLLKMHLHLYLILSCNIAKSKISIHISLSRVTVRYDPSFTTIQILQNQNLSAQHNVPIYLGSLKQKSCINAARDPSMFL